MSLIARFLGTRSADDAALATARIVVTDVETSGLDPHRDSLISIGAVAITGTLARFDDSFAAVLRQARPSTPQNILVHGIDVATQLGGTEPAEALAAWMRYAGDAPLVGFHADFDRIVLTRAVRERVGVKLDNVWLDVAFVLPAFFSNAPAVRPDATLDDWMRVFGIEAYARHDALSDALATAQLFQIALAQAARRGIRTLGAMRRLERDQRRLARASLV